MVGYATIYTMAPVFSLILDRDVSEDLALLYPELYKELNKVTNARLTFVHRIADHLTVYRVGRYRIKRSSNG